MKKLKKIKRIGLALFACFSLFVIIVGTHANNADNSNNFGNVNAAEIGKTYWKLDNNVLHLSGVQTDGYNLIEEDSLGIYSDYSPWYEEKNSIEEVVFDSEVRPQSTRCWFKDCLNLTKISDIQNLNTSNVEDMSYMFYGCKELSSVDLSKFNASNTKYMSYMFEGCSSILRLDVSNLETSSLESSSHMFKNCTSLTEIVGLEKLNTSKIFSMSNMFNGCENLTSLKISDWDISSTTNMRKMFYNCRSLSDLDISKWNISKATDTSQMFYGCEKLDNVDKSEFEETGNSEDVNNNQFNTESLKSNPLVSIANNFTNTIQTNLIQANVLSDVTPNVTPADVSEDDGVMVAADSTVGEVYWWLDGNTLHLSNEAFTSNYRLINESNLGKFRAYNPWYSSRTSITTVVFDTEVKPTNTKYWFYSCSKISEIKDIEKLNTSNVVDMSFMFYVCSSLTNLDLSNFDLSSVQDATKTLNGYSYPNILKTPSSRNGTFTIPLPLDMYENNETKTKYVKGSDVPADKTLYRGYPLTLDLNGGQLKEGSVLDNIKLYGIDFDTAINNDKIENPGFEFKGWEDANGNIVSTYSENAEGTLKAAWKKIRPIDLIVAEGSNDAENMALSTSKETLDQQNGNTVTFVNTLTLTQDLTVSKKTVDLFGSNYNTDEQFEITINFSEMQPGSFFSSDIGKIKADDEGLAEKTFLVKNGESVKFYSIPVGVQYTITESKSKDFKASYNILNSTQTELSTNKNDAVNKPLSTETETVNQDENAEVQFVNEHVAPPVQLISTGGNGKKIAVVVAGILAGIALITIVLAKKKESED